MDTVITNPNYKFEKKFHFYYLFRICIFLFTFSLTLGPDFFSLFNIHNLHFPINNVFDYHKLSIYNLKN
jgi:hypothetical protein